LLKSMFDRTEVFATFEGKSSMQLPQRVQADSLFPPPLFFLIIFLVKTLLIY
jgi:hypothetical protein